MAETPITTEAGTISEDDRKKYEVPENVKDWGALVKMMKDTKADHTRATQDLAESQRLRSEEANTYLSKLDENVPPATTQSQSSGNTVLDGYRQGMVDNPADTTLQMLRDNNQYMLDQLDAREKKRGENEIEKLKVKNTRALEKQKEDVIQAFNISSQEYLTMEPEIKQELNKLPDISDLQGNEMERIVDGIRGRQARENATKEVQIKMESDARDKVRTETGGTTAPLGTGEPQAPGPDASLEELEAHLEKELKDMTGKEFANLPGTPGD